MRDRTGVVRWTHNPEVIGSNPIPATKTIITMNPVKFKDQTGEFGKPESMKAEECSNLPMKRTMNGNYPSIESVWELSDEELETVKQSKRIRIGILGNGMPPIYMLAEEVENIDPQPAEIGG